MAQTDAHRLIAARELARQMFALVSTTATLNLDDLKAAVATVDTAMDLLPASLNATRTVKQNINDNFPEPFKSIATAQHKALSIMVWAMKEGNLI